MELIDTSDVRDELERLVGQDAVPKELALAIVRLHHRMEEALREQHVASVREIDRLTHELEQRSLKAEVDALTLRQQILQSDVRIDPSMGRRRG